MNRMNGDGAAPRRPPGMLEDEVLAVLWALGRPMTPAEVQLELGDRLAYTTVMSTLTRLHRKNLVTREPTARGGYSYAPTMDEADHTARAMTELLDRRRDRAGTLARFVSSLPPEDEALLQRLLQAEGGA
ncbi:BlaI/MecI/CopY family transcriptional regulator [Actinoallomurus liliacearum]|uniref:BlaI/MecI/CopY family transcriptional regulator n=2 Tax=Thermomonosporaceae TaxID=2012 RepID=A0ABP8TAU0_9ACTN